MTAKPEPDDTLDPEDWEAFRALAHDMLDEQSTISSCIRERPVWQRHA